MKYRLKKDLPDMEAGELFDDTDSFGHETSSMFDSRGAYRFEKDDIKHFDEWFEEVKESGWWKPKFDEEYYFLDNTGDVDVYPWQNDEIDEYRYSVGNCFKTEKAAERYRDYLKAIATVRQDEGVLTPEQAANNGYIYYICTHNEFGPVVHGFNADYVSVNTVLFDTREHAQASLDKHPDEWEIIANYDWSRE